MMISELKKTRSRETRSNHDVPGPDLDPEQVGAGLAGWHIGLIGLVLTACICIQFIRPDQSWATDVYLDISSSEVRKISLALPYFHVPLNQPELLTLRNEALKILTYDLKESGLFQIIDVTAYSQEINSLYQQTKQLPYTAWYLADVQAMVIGDIVQSGDKLTLNGNLFDLKMEAMMTGKKYTGTESLFRQMVHKFADEIIFRFTGEKGIGHSRIAFVHEQGEAKELFVMDYDGFNVQQLTSNRSLNLSPDWDTQGEQLFFTSYYEGNPGIYRLTLNTHRITRLTSFAGINSAPAVSPDGKRLALTLSIDGNSEIYVMKTNGENLTRLTFHKGIDTSPSWSPSGRYLVFTSDRVGSPQLYIIDAEGVDMKRLTFQGSYNDSADWSPQGDLIVYSSRNQGTFDIWTTNVDGTKVRQLTNNAGNNENPSFSPDGNFICFSSSRNGKPALYVMDKFGYNQRKISLQSGACILPDWSP
ncbi:Tol-Pal system beta propeller repeat protein TolB [bacterium]|nr:Tol-Pal system beta propeller repeat protein TolB [bacterium]